MNIFLQVVMRSVLLMVCLWIVIGVVSGAVPSLSAQAIPGELTLDLPDGWSVDNFQCQGISITNPEDPAYGIMFLNHLHQYPNLLSLGTTPEQYVSEFFAQDLALSGKNAADVQILGYEEADFSGISAFGTIDVKGMKVSLTINGFPVIAYLTVGTYDVTYGTVLAYLWGFYGPADTITEDGIVMKQVFDSIQFNEEYTAECSDVLRRKWRLAA